MAPKQNRQGKKARALARKRAEEAAAARETAEAEAAARGETLPTHAEEVAAAAEVAKAEAAAVAEAEEAASGAGGMTAMESALEAAAEAAASATMAEEEMVGEYHHRRLMDEAMAKVSLTFTTNPKTVHPNGRDIKVEGLNVNLGPKELVKDATMSLNWGNRYSLIGANGSGKSILMTILGRRLVPIPESLDIYHVVSEVEPSDLGALEAVLAVDSVKKALEAEGEALTDALGTLAEEDEEAMEEMSERISDIYERLELLGADTAEARAASILHGLGFDPAMQAKACKDFSGGWRMRIALARALFLDPSVLLLDEPTNHLDMEAVVWLERYLAKREKILLMVSHSQDFLNAVTTHTIHFSEGKLATYSGNYDSFCQTRKEKEEHQMKRYQWEQDQIKAMKQYIAKFGHGSAKLAKQAQSKEKTLAKMQEKGLTKAVGKDRFITMSWPDPGILPPPVLQILNVSFKYPKGEFLYKDLDFGLDLDSRVALVGPNGAGKTTLLKLICHELHPVEGQVKPHAHLRIAKYTQHFVDTLDLDRTPLDYFASLGPLKDETEQSLRQYLGKFAVTGDFQTTEMKYLSDGIKSRVVFAQMAVFKPHILMLDEPTNHLDIETIDSLADAINDFKGGVILVSHDMRLISQVAKEIWECDKRTITRFIGEISDYKAFLARRVEAAQEAFERERRGEAAAAVEEVSANEFAARLIAKREGAAAGAAAVAAAAGADGAAPAPAPAPGFAAASASAAAPRPAARPVVKRAAAAVVADGAAWR